MANVDARGEPSTSQTPKVQFRPFQPRDTQATIDLLSVGRPAGYRSHKARLFDWQFLGNPHGNGRAPFLVGELDGRIVALNGFMPVRARFHGQPIDASWSCDTYVSSEHRGKGIGKQLIAQVTRHAPLMLGYGISDMSDPIFEKFAWRKHPDIELMFFHLAERGLRGTVKNLVSRVASLRHTHTQGADHEVWDSITPQRRGELDELWARNVDGFPCAVQRDGAYMQWKYFEHPFYRYRAYATRTGSRLTAVFIVRIEPTETVIADYSGPAENESVIARLAAEVVRAVGDEGTTRVRCESTHKPLLSALKRVGFISSPHRSRFRVHATTDGIDPLRGWLLMPGDSDGDLLVGTSLEGAQ